MRGFRIATQAPAHGAHGLDPQRVVVREERVPARASHPGEVVGETVVERPLPPHGVLQRSRDEETLVAPVDAAADDAVDGP